MDAILDAFEALQTMSWSGFGKGSATSSWGVLSSIQRGVFERRDDK